MNISQIRLENFKSFENIDVKLNKLTLLTGANSSGKSSLIYGMLTPLQSGDFPLHFSTNGKYINMGDFEDISHLHNKNNIITIGYTLEQHKKFIDIDSFWKFDKVRKLPKFFGLNSRSDHYKLEIKTNQDESLSLRFEYFKEKDEVDRLNSLDFQRKIHQLINESITKSDRGKRYAEKSIKQLEERFKRNDKTISLRAKDLKSLYRSISEKGSYTLTQVFSEIISNFKHLDDKVNYISSFRFHPQKFRNEITKDNLRIGKYGDNYEDQILQWQTNNEKQFEELVKKLKLIGILQDIRTQRISGGNYEIKVKTHISGVYSSLTDVGFGISQFLPIIVSDIQLGKGSTLFVSQPEIHLHPKVQSEFGDYLLNEIKSSDKRYVVETHSEYLLNKVRLLIVQKKLKPEDVNIYYFQKKGNKTIKHELEFTIDGQILNAPSDFFDTYMTDVLEIALNS